MTELYRWLLDENVLHTVDRLPETTYNSSNDVSERMGKLM